MRILADENMSASAVERLRADGHDVEWVVESYRSAPDSDLLRTATRDRRTLVTFDRDFGRLLHIEGASAPYGVVYFRISDDIPADLRDEFIIRVVGIRETWPPGVWSAHLRHSMPERA